MDANHFAWPALTYETLPWKRDPDDLALVPRSARRRIGSTYEAALPARIADLDLTPTSDLLDRVADLAGGLARFDAAQQARGYDLPALLLRSESAASSQIENLTSSVRNVAMAEMVDDAPHNAQLIAGNLEAMRAALGLPGGIDVATILEIQKRLVNRNGQTFAGSLRGEQVWVGGTPYSPHGATFVPPAAARVGACLDDLVAFAARDDIQPIAKAAVFHAQFETIHPFVDGNGRTGRTLLHRMLRLDGVLMQATLPVSAGLLHNADAYMAAISDYQMGDPMPMVGQMIGALELALSIGIAVADHIDEVIAGWTESMHERRGSSMHRLPGLLVVQPVVNAGYVASSLGITDRAARNLLQRACELGIVRPMGNRRRGVLYQADELIDVLEEASSAAGIRRIVAGVGR